MTDLLNKLAEAAAVDFEHAASMPPEIYYSAEFLALEIEEIFRKEWICIGRTAEIPNTGDYLTFELLDQFRMRWSVSIPPEIMHGIDDPGKHIDETRGLLTAVNAEDKGIIRKVFQGLRSNQAAPGPYAYLERNVFHFGRYLARQLTR